MNWEEKEWNEVLTIRNGRSQKNVVNPDGKYPIYGSGGIMGYADDYICEEGTTIIGRKGSINSPIFVQEKFWNVDTAFGLVPSDLLDNKFFYYWCTTYNFLKHNKATTLPSLTKADLLKIKIPLPPIDQQKKIAAILDAADAYRQKTKALIAKYDELTQSLFLDMFGDPVTNPKGWDFKKLEEVSILTTKGSSPKWQGFEYISEGVRFVTSENVRLGYLDISKDKFVADEFHEKLHRSQLKENDLLVNLVGASIGRGALVPNDALPSNINQAVAKTELDTSLVHPKFILHQIITPQLQERLVGNKVEGARANISLKNVRELNVYAPPLVLQNEFAERVQAIEVQKAQAQESLAKAEELFNSLLQRAFKGELC